MLCLHFPGGGLSRNLSFVTQPLAIVTSGFPSNSKVHRKLKYFRSMKGGKRNEENAGNAMHACPAAAAAA